VSIPPPGAPRGSLGEPQRTMLKNGVTIVTLPTIDSRSSARHSI
jgi:hypothetical protein